MTPEHELLSLIMQTGNLQEALEWGIEPDDFFGFDTRPVMDRLLSVYNDPATQGAVIGKQLALNTYFPNWAFRSDPGSTIPLLCQEVRKRRLAKELKKVSEECVSTVDYDTVGAYQRMELLIEMYRNLGVTKKTDVNKGEGYRRTIERYKRAQQGLIGIAPWPWPTLNGLSGGLAWDEFAIFFGRPKSMKTWVLCYLIWWFACIQGMRVLVYTKEMYIDDIYQRLVSLDLQVLYQEVRLGQLSEEKFGLYLALIQDLESGLSDTNNIIGLSASDVNGQDTPGWLRSKIKRYKPNLVALDGVYKMTPSNTKLTKEHERVSNVIRGLRQVILDEKVPMLATSQANRGAAKHEAANTEDAAFTDAIGQEVTMLCRVIKDKERPRINLVFAATREFAINGLAINAVCAQDFSEVSILTEGETISLSQKDEEDARAEASTPTEREETPKKSKKLKRQEAAYAGATEVKDLLDTTTKGLLCRSVKRYWRSATSTSFA